MNDQRLGVACGIDDRCEKRIRREHTIAACNGGLRGRNQKVDIRGSDNVSIVVIQKTVEAREGNLRIAEAHELPDCGLHLTVVVLAAEGRIGREILRQQPVHLIDLRLAERCKADGHVTCRGCAAVVICKVRSGCKRDVDKRIQTVRIVDAVRDQRIGATRDDHVEKAGCQKVWLLTKCRTGNVGCRRGNANRECAHAFGALF